MAAEKAEKESEEGGVSEWDGIASGARGAPTDQAS